MIGSEEVFWMSMGALAASVIVGAVGLVGWLVTSWLDRHAEDDNAPDSWELIDGLGGRS